MSLHGMITCPEARIHSYSAVFQQNTTFYLLIRGLLLLNVYQHSESASWQTAQGLL